MSASDSPSRHVEILYANHHGWLRNWLRRKLGCNDQAADLAHDTFLKVLGMPNALAGVQEPRAYLSTMARRLLIDRVRHQQIEQAYLAELALIADDLPVAPSPEAVLMAIQALQQFSDALAALPAKASEAFLLHYLHEKTQPEIAAHFGISIRMVQKYLAQALLHCHAALTEEPHGR